MDHARDEVPRSPGRADDLFFDDVVSQYVDDPRYIHREWLETAVQERLEQSGCRYVLIVGEPGAGKSGVIAGLSARHPDWLRYFIRRDSITPLSGGDAVSMLLRVGHQLAARRPQLFELERLEVVVEQRVAAAGAGASVVGIRVEDLAVSPFRRTSIRVEQHVAELGGRLVGLDVAHATVEPRLLAEVNLQFLALIDPATALAAAAPEARIVILVDAVDEALGFRGGGMSIVDWLESSPELPDNVQIVLSSRPHPRLATLQDQRAGSVELIDLQDPRESRPVADAHSFTADLLEEPELAVRVTAPAKVADRIALASEGNFAYLRAWERGLVAAIGEGNDELTDQLLTLETIPSGLGELYAVFLRNARAEIGRLGALDVEEPHSAEDQVTPAWEGVGQRVVAILAIARAPLTVEQLMRLGAIRVWRSATDNVMQRLRPLLEEAELGWRFFHPSVADFLVGEAERKAPDLFVRSSEWHRRVVRSYAGTLAWADLDWTAVDDYGLLHIADHLAELGSGQHQIVELVNRGLRAAMRLRFLTDQPFRRLVETALAHVDTQRTPADVLADTLFLDIVRHDLRDTGERLAPAVFGLMARLGRFEEAKARTELLPPSEHRFRATQALVACAPPAKRHLLGRYDGVEMLLAAAAEVPAVDGSLFTGLRSREAAEEAAVALAPHDLNRALEIARSAEPTWDPDRVRDLVLLTAARARPPQTGAAMIDQMTGGRAVAAAEFARLVAAPEQERLLALAEDDVAQGRAKEQLVALAGLVVAWQQISQERADQSAADLLAAGAIPKTDAYQALVAAERVADTHPSLADALLDSVAATEITGSWAQIRAVRLWGTALRRPEKARALAERILEYERGLGWFGPAGSIAELAVAIDTFDPEWAQCLADEAEELIVTAAEANTDPYESRISLTLGHAAKAFRQWDPPRALRLAQRMSGSWISGNSWDSFAGRLSALACLGLDASTTDATLARELLEACLPPEEPHSLLGRVDPRLVHGGFFRPVEDESPEGGGAPSMSRMVKFATYMTNSVNYWHSARDRLPFLEPADIARSMQVSPAVLGSTSSWASVIAAGVVPVSAVDVDLSLALVGWIADPAERLIAVAGLVPALTSTVDSRVTGAVGEVGRCAVRLPRYVPELEAIDRAPALSYLNPAARARFEAALLLPAEQDGLAASLVAASGFWYLTATARAQKLVALLYGPEVTELDCTQVVSLVQQALVTAEAIPDPIHQDLIRLAAVWAVAPCNVGIAQQIVADIKHPGRQHLGKLYVAALSSIDESDAAASVRSVLNDAPPDLEPLHRIMALATGMACLDTDGRAELADQGIAILADADPWSAAQGLLLLAHSAAPEQRGGLERAAQGRAEGIENPYLRVDLLADLLGHAASAGDVELLVAVARRELDAGWQVLMEGLRRAVASLVAIAGKDVFARLDCAFRAAQAIVGPTDPAPHLDGVAPPALRELAPLGRRGLASASAEGGINSLFLEGDDLPGMHLVQDSSDSAPAADDYAYAACDGIGTGLRVWLAPATQPVWRLVDIRFAFPDAARAAAYHAERLVANAEGQPPVLDAPLIGEDCRVFGGDVKMSALGLDMRAFYYVFRVGSVVVKLFAAQGPVASERLEARHLYTITERALARLVARTR